MSTLVLDVHEELVGDDAGEAPNSCMHVGEICNLARFAPEPPGINSGRNAENLPSVPCTLCFCVISGPMKESNQCAPYPHDCRRGLGTHPGVKFSLLNFAATY